MHFKGLSKYSKSMERKILLKDLELNINYPAKENYDSYRLLRDAKVNSIVNMYKTGSFSSIGLNSSN